MEFVRFKDMSDSYLQEQRRGLHRTTQSVTSLFNSLSLDHPNGSTFTLLPIMEQLVARLYRYNPVFGLVKDISMDDNEMTNDVRSITNKDLISPSGLLDSLLDEDTKNLSVLGCSIRSR
ncbi:hypothetical protein PROFUN_17099, partial [Planoprotostelium fungivorum]